VQIEIRAAGSLFPPNVGAGGGDLLLGRAKGLLAGDKAPCWGGRPASRALREVLVPTATMPGPASSQRAIGQLQS